MKLVNARIIDGLASEAYTGTLEFGSTIDAVTATSGEQAVEEYTVLPGLIDAHTHLSLSGEVFEWWRNEESTAAIVLRTYRNANQHLDAGETTVRDLGGIKDTVIQ